MSLPNPVGRQHEVLYLPATGHSVILGTAGSGKTTIAMLRASYLARRDAPHGGPTLLVTYNNALVKYLEHLGGSELRGVTVETFHKFARGYLNSTIGFPRHNAIIPNQRKKLLIRRAIAAVTTETDHHPVLERPVRFYEDEIQWIASHGIESADQYVDTDRVGRRGSYLARRDRSLVYRVSEAYHKLRAEEGYPYDWDEVVNAAHRELAADKTSRRYRHIVIDEGQDFTPQMLRALVLGVPPDGSVSFFGDYVQQIYGSRLSWRAVGFKISKVEQFAENYRNSAPIAELALAIAAMPYFGEIPDLVVPKGPTAKGPKPAVRRFSTLQDEVAFLNAFVSRQISRRSVAVLFRKRSDEGSLDGDLKRRGIRLDKNMTRFFVDAGLYYGTYHAAKGLEFDMVVLPMCSADRLPDTGEVAAFGLDEAMAAEGRLLYVGTTRARRELVITYTEKPTSLLPAQAELYQLSDA